MKNLPAADEVLRLPTLLDVELTEDHLGPDGHMNVRSYLGLFDDASLRYFDWLSVRPASQARPRGIFTVEHHLHYYSELFAGDTVAISVRLLGRRRKSVSLLAFMVDRSRSRIASTCEQVSVYMDLSTRSAIEFENDGAQVPIDAQIERDREWSTSLAATSG